MSSKLFVEEEKERVVIEVDGDDDDEQKISLVPIHSHGKTLTAPQDDGKSEGLHRFCKSTVRVSDRRIIYRTTDFLFAAITEFSSSCKMH